MRVLQILHDRERGGIATLADMIAEGLQAHGIAVETAYLFPRPGLTLDTLTKLQCAGAMARRILRDDFDALIAYQATASILAGTIGRLRGCRTRIVHQTCTPGATTAPIRLIDKLAGSLGFYTVNITNSVATQNEFESYPSLYRRRLMLIEHGLDVPVAKRSRATTRQHFGLPATSPVLLNTGRLVAQKNQGVVIRALKAIPEAHLAIAGNGAGEASYRALAAELGVADRLHLLGPLSPGDVADLYACADLFAFPSTWETFGLSAVEAAMMGLPAVVADLAVLREVLATPGPQPVTFVDPFDVDGWAAAIRAQLDVPVAADVRLDFSRAIARKYSRKRMIDSYLKLLSSHPQFASQRLMEGQPT